MAGTRFHCANHKRHGTQTVTQGLAAEGRPVLLLQPRAEGPWEGMLLARRDEAAAPEAEAAVVDVPGTPAPSCEPGDGEIACDGVRFADLPHGGSIWHAGSLVPAWRQELLALGARPDAAALDAMGQRGIWLQPQGDVPPLAVMCCGQGAVWPGMGRELYDHFPAARAAMDRIARAADWDVLALLEHHLARRRVQLRTGCTVSALAQSRGGYAVQFQNAEGTAETLRADAVICAMGGAAGPQFGTDGFGPRFAGQCGGRVEPLYPCLTALQCAAPDKALAGIRAKAAASLLDGTHVLAVETGEVQFTDYGLSGICIMQLSGLLAPGRGPKAPAVELDLFPALDEAALAGLLAAHARQTAGERPADFWLGLLNPKLGRALWSAAALPDTAALTPGQWQKLARTAKHWRFEGLTPCGWKQAQVTGGGLALREVDTHFQFKGCPGLYFVGETLDCTGSCGGFNLHWAFGSGIAAGQAAGRCAAAGHRPPQSGRDPRKKRSR